MFLVKLPVRFLEIETFDMKRRRRDETADEGLYFQTFLRFTSTIFTRQKGKDMVFKSISMNRGRLFNIFYFISDTALKESRKTANSQLHVEEKY